jgi:hypothetical protein
LLSGLTTETVSIGTSLLSAFTVRTWPLAYCVSHLYGSSSNSSSSCAPLLLCALWRSEPGKSNPLRSLSNAHRVDPQHQPGHTGLQLTPSLPASQRLICLIFVLLQAADTTPLTRRPPTHALGSDELEPGHSPYPQGLVIATSPHIWGPAPFLFPSTGPLRICLQHFEGANDEHTKRRLLLGRLTTRPSTTS